MTHHSSKYVFTALASLVLAGCGVDEKPDRPLTESPPSFALERLSMPISSGGMAVHDPQFQAPACLTPGSACDTGTLVDGRAQLGPEINAPNTIGSSCADGTSGTYHVDESVDHVRIYTADGGEFLPGKEVIVEATVWAFSNYQTNKFDLFYATEAAAPQWTHITTLQPSQAGAQTLSTSFMLTEGSDVQAIRAIMRYLSSAGPCVVSNYTDRDDVVFRLGDAPPQVILTAPGGIVSGTVALSASASDDIEVARVNFYAGSQYLGYDSAGPYQLNWYTTLFNDGAYELTAEAVDSAGQTTSSAPLSVIVDNLAPSVSFTSPTSEEEISGTVSLQASASDINGVTRVEFFKGSTLLGTALSEPYTIDWDTLGTSNGSQVLIARAYDVAGRSSETLLAVLVANDLPPTGDITAPAPGAVLSGTANFTVSAMDDVGVDRVTFYLGTQYITWDGKAPYSINFNTLNFINGEYVLTARIFDTAGQMTTTVEVPVTIQN